ncbi:hypothetical protein R3P38DRAFT_3362727 [Favolaschia claudopus]|uniref:Uncharacterized protein n=1 Tax=Favolaschia claudopus TaxID=2862362 RepID=A0AAW0AKU7_9AGAR
MHLIGGESSGLDALPEHLRALTDGSSRQMRCSIENAPVVGAFPRCGCAVPPTGIFTFTGQRSCVSPSGCPGIRSSAYGTAAAVVATGLLNGLCLERGSRREACVRAELWTLKEVRAYGACGFVWLGGGGGRLPLRAGIDRDGDASVGVKRMKRVVHFAEKKCAVGAGDGRLNLVNARRLGALRVKGVDKAWVLGGRQCSFCEDDAEEYAAAGIATDELREKAGGYREGIGRVAYKDEKMDRGSVLVDEPFGNYRCFGGLISSSCVFFALGFSL